jgi:hypothetical protein
LTIFATNSSRTISNVRLADADIYRVVVCPTPVASGLFIATALRERLVFSAADGCVHAIWSKHVLAAERSGLPSSKALRPFQKSMGSIIFSIRERDESRFTV